MRYYITADVHSYYDELIKALTENGFFEDREPHKLIICGDLFDRGPEALKLQDFVLDLMGKDEVILIRGNHEDLALDLMNDMIKGKNIGHHHYSNGTMYTVFQLLKANYDDLSCNQKKLGEDFSNCPFVKTIIPSMVNYYETERYIFVHGWIPCVSILTSPHERRYEFIEDWRNADEKAWDNARWTNGMEAAHGGIVEKGKIIVCGHWCTSFGHHFYEGDGGEFDDSSNFNPYYGDGIIALDACTAFSKKTNCIIIEE